MFEILAVNKQGSNDKKKMSFYSIKESLLNAILICVEYESGMGKLNNKELLYSFSVIHPRMKIIT